MLARLTRSPSLVALLLLLAVVVVWGTTFALVKSALADTPPLLFNLLRMSLAFALLALWNRHSLRSLTRADLRYGALAGCLLGLGYQFQTAGLARTSASKAAFLTGLVVILVPLLSSLPALRPSSMPAPRWSSFAGAAVAFTGLLLLTAPAGARSGTLAGFSLIPGLGIGAGELLCLACAFAFAAHLLFLAGAAPHIRARTLGTLQIGSAATLMLLTLPFSGTLYLHWTPRLVFALGVTAVLATAAAFTIQSWAQQHLSATQTALIFTLEPVFAWLTSVLFLHEHLRPREILGAGLILTGILLGELAAAVAPSTPAAQGDISSQSASK